MSELRIQSRLDYNLYLQHKDYFDASLIELLGKLQKKVEKLENEKTIRSAQIHRQAGTIKALRLKIKDLESINGTLKLKLSDKDVDIQDLIHQFEIIQKEAYKEIEEIKSENEELKNGLKEMEKELKELRKLKKKIIRKDSTNSSIPPSHDFTRTKANVNNRAKSGNAKGGQVGHEAHTSKLKDNPDKIKKIYVKKAPTGAKECVDEDGKTYYAIQEIDSRLVTTISETRFYIDPICGEELAEETTRKYKINGVSYSNAFRSMVLYLNGKGIIALDRLCDILNEMSNNELHLSAGSVVNWAHEFSLKSEQECNNTLNTLINSEVIHVDETGSKVNGKRTWMHGITDGVNTFYVATNTRADKETGPLALLKDYDGILVHDHFKSYYTNISNARHAECNAHILRYLKAGLEIYECVGCAAMIKLLEKGLKRKEELIAAGKNEMDEKEIKEFEAEYDRIIHETITSYEAAHPEMQSKKKKKFIPDSIKTLKRMKEYKIEHLRFLTDFSVPFTNNSAENCMRFSKNKHKISGQFSSIETSNDYARMMTIIRTSSLKKENVLKTIENILSQASVKV